SAAIGHLRLVAVGLEGLTGGETASGVPASVKDTVCRWSHLQPFARTPLAVSPPGTSARSPPSYFLGGSPPPLFAPLPRSSSSSRSFSSRVSRFGGVVGGGGGGVVFTFGSGGGGGGVGVDLTIGTSIRSSL